MYTRHKLGQYGEEVAKRYIQLKGYKIIQSNFSCRQGEIDIIAYDDKEMVFIEVKTRSNLFYGYPVDAVNLTKQTHMYRVAKYYLHLKKLEKCFIRFDVIEVYIERGRARVNHIKQII